MRVPDDAWCITINQANKADGVIHRKAWPEEPGRVRGDDAPARRRVAVHPHGGVAVHESALDIRGYLDGLVPRWTGSRSLDPAYRLEHPVRCAGRDLRRRTSCSPCSMGEGFGLTPLEAQACGTPVVMSDWAAQPGTCGDGWLVRVSRSGMAGHRTRGG